MAVKLSQLKAKEAFYTHVMQDTGQVHHLAIDRLRNYMENSGHFKTEWYAITEQFIRHYREGRLGVEEPHLRSLPEAALDAPCLLIDWEDGDHTLADGNHRVVRRAMRGDVNFEAYSAPKRVWSRFLIEDMPHRPAEHWNNFVKNAQVRGPKETWRMK